MFNFLLFLFCLSLFASLIAHITTPLQYLHMSRSAQTKQHRELLFRLPATKYASYHSSQTAADKTSRGRCLNSRRLIVGSELNPTMRHLSIQLVFLQVNKDALDQFTIMFTDSHSLSLPLRYAVASCPCPHPQLS